MLIYVWRNLLGTQRKNEQVVDTVVPIMQNVSTTSG